LQKIFLAPVGLVPIPLSVIAVMTQNLKIVEVQSQIGKKFAWFDVVNIHHSPIFWGSSAALTPGAMFLQSHHANFAPFVS